MEQALAEPIATPAGLTVLAVLDFIAAGACVSSLAYLAFGRSMMRYCGGLSILYLIYAVGYAGVGRGTLTLRAWARVLYIVLSAIGLLAFPVGTIINGCIIYYLTRPRVVSAFSSER